jgi:hypothetical protein
MLPPGASACIHKTLEDPEGHLAHNTRTAYYGGHGGGGGGVSTRRLQEGGNHVSLLLEYSELQPVRVVVPKWKAHRATLAGEQGEETTNVTNYVGSLYIIKLSARVSSARPAWCGVCGNE